MSNEHIEYYKHAASHHEKAAHHHREEGYHHEVLNSLYKIVNQNLYDDFRWNNQPTF